MMKYKGCTGFDDIFARHGLRGECLVAYAPRGLRFWRERKVLNVTVRVSGFNAAGYARSIDVGYGSARLWPEQIESLAKSTAGYWARSVEP